MATYLVTGAAGFIGSNLVRALLHQGHRVCGIDNFATGKRDNLEGLTALEFIESDINDIATLEAAMNNVDYVLHQAAIPSVPRSIEDPTASHHANATGTLSVLEAARRVGSVRRVIYASSSSVYGNTPALPKHESMPTQPLSPYAVSKLTAEQYVMVYHRLYGVSAVALRYFNVFGPYQDPDSSYAALMPTLITCIARGVSPPIYGDGLQSRDFTYVDNVVQANLLACTAPRAAGEVLNVACGAAITILDAIGFVNEALGKRVAATHHPPRSGDIRHSVADISKAVELLGFVPHVSAAEGLWRYVCWYADRHGLRPPIGLSRSGPTPGRAAAVPDEAAACASQTPPVAEHAHEKARAI